MAKIPCPPEAVLLPVALGETAPPDVREHLDDCPGCRDRLARLSGEVRALRDRPAGLGAGPPPGPHPDRTRSETATFDHAPAGPRAAMIGKYVIIGQLDEGGQGLVYRAVHADLHHDAVIKLARRPMAGGDPDLLRNDGQMLAGLRHENLVQVYDMGVHEGRPFLAIEFVRGCTLEQRAAQRRYPPREAASVVARVARAVAYLDARGIVHQDIKPRNILIDEAGRPRLIDFGLARLHDIWSGVAVGPVGGTYAYMAPEQARGDVDRIGPATDVFALGGVLYFLLTGRAPNEGGEAGPVLERARRGLVDRAALSAPGIPPRLARITRKALAADPRERPSAGELAADLERFARGTSRRIALAAGMIVPLVAVGALWWDRGGKGPIDGPDPVRAGSKWAGSFYWLTDPRKWPHPFILSITDRRGSRFSGVCEGVGEQDREFSCRIEGSIRGPMIRWHYLEQLKGDRIDAATLHAAQVEGHIEGKTMSLRYADPDVAFYELRLVEAP